MNRLTAFESPRVRTVLCLGFLFALNVFICRNLFHAEFTQETASVDVIFMAFSRWLAEHWSDRDWFPMWVSGTPVREVYNPLLHHSVALLSRLSGWTAQHAYHFVTATTYSLGPLTLFWLCYRFTQRHGYALSTALIYSLLSPSVFLVRELRADNGGWFGPRRFQTLAHYGEGPHVTALMLIPLVIWLIDEAAAKRRWVFLPLATLALAAIPLTNWTGTTGLTMALTAYLLAKAGAGRMGESPIHWPTLAGIGVLAYSLASYWIPVSLIRTVQASAASLDIVTPFAQKAAIVGFAVLALSILHFYFRHRGAPTIFRFFVYFTVISGTAVLSKMWFGAVLIPIAHRFQLEMEMAIAGCAAFASLAFAVRWPRGLRIAAAVVLVAAGISQARYYRRAVRNTTNAADISKISEAPMSQWIAANANGERVFAPGTVALWLNNFTNTPQIFGCCDQTVRTAELRAALYYIYSGSSGEISVAWLKAYGVSYIGIADTGGDQPFGDIHKFEGVLEEAWRDTNNVVYRVPNPSASLAHVVPTDVLNIRALVSGWDVEPLQPLIASLENPPGPVSFRWVNQHEAEITAVTGSDQAVFVQETCDPGWHAYEGITERKVSCGPLGLIVVDPAYAGPHRIRLIYSASAEDRLTRVAQLSGLGVLIVWTLVSRRRRVPVLA